MAKKKRQKSENPSKSWTVQELRRWIRKETKEVNKLIKEYRENVAKGLKQPNRQIEEQIVRLVAFGTGRRGRKGEVGVGVETKRKDALIMQAKGLERYKRWETGSIESDTKRKEQLQKQYEGFKRTTGSDISYDDYISLVETWGSIGSSIMTDFGYENLGPILETATEEQKRNLAPIMIELEKESKGKQWTQEDLLDRLNERLKSLS